MRALLAAALLCACAAPRAATKARPVNETDARRARLIDRIGGMAAFSALLRADGKEGPLLAGKAVEAAARGEDAEALSLARAARQADPSNEARRRLFEALGGKEDAPPPPKTLRAAPGVDARRNRVLERLGGADAFGELLRGDDLDGPLLAGQALEAYAQSSELKAVLLAQAALGADPGNGARRRLLRALEELSGIAADPEGALPLAALVQHELSRAETAFFERRFGAALQACRRALLLAPDDRKAWLRLGSSHFALGDEARAREAWKRASGDPALARFLNERGWDGPEMNR